MRGTVTCLPPGHALAKRLIALGLNPGAEVCVLENRGRGPLIVEVHGARLALGRGQAERVDCKPLPAPAGSAAADSEGVAAVHSTHTRRGLGRHRSSHRGLGHHDHAHEDPGSDRHDRDTQGAIIEE
jgi:Fe2+ transport system protein FeoA